MSHLEEHQSKQPHGNHEHGQHEHSQHTHGDNHEAVWSEPTPELIEHLETAERLAAPITNAALDLVSEILAKETTPQPPATIIELGSGAGIEAAAIAQRFQNATVHLVDISAKMLEHAAMIAAENAPGRIKTHAADLNHGLPTSIKEKADIIWSALSLHHLEDHKKSLVNVLNALKPGGIFVLIEQQGDTRVTPDDGSIGISNFNERFGELISIPREFTTIDWQSLLEDAGYEGVQSFEHDFVAHSVSGSTHLTNKLARVAAQLLPELTPAEREAFDRALQAVKTQSIDLALTSTRQIWLARRPA